MILTILAYVGIVIAVYKLFQIANDLGEIKALLSRNGGLPATPSGPVSGDTIASLRALGADSESYADHLLRQVRSEAEPRWAAPAPVPNAAASPSEQWSASSHSAEAIEDESEIEYEEQDVYEQDLAEQDVEPEELQALTPEIVAPRTYESKIESRIPQPPALRSSTLPASIPLNELFESQRGNTEAPTSALNSIALKSVAVQSIPATPTSAHITPVHASVAPQVIPPQVSLQQPQGIEPARQLNALSSSLDVTTRQEAPAPFSSGIAISSITPRMHEVRLPAPPDARELPAQGSARQHYSESIATEELPTTIFLRSSDESSIHSDLPSFTPSKRSWEDGI